MENDSPIAESLVHFGRVASWMDDQKLGAGPLGQIELLTGGTGGTEERLWATLREALNLSYTATQCRP